MKKHLRAAFTLIEVLLAVAILGLVSTTVALVLHVGVESWRAGTELSETGHDAEAIFEQVCMALRSAYYPANGKADYEYGFQHEDDGEEEDAHDVISWVKIGASLVGEDNAWAGSAHRVKLYVSDDRSGDGPGLYVAAWQLVGEPEDFDPDEDVEPILLSDRVVGLDCRMQDPDVLVEPGEPYEWIDEWISSNRIPRHVQITLAVKPIQENAKEPDVLVRMVEIPMAEVSWDPKKVGEDRRGGRRSGPVIDLTTPHGRASAPAQIFRNGGSAPPMGNGNGGPR